MSHVPAKIDSIPGKFDFKSIHPDPKQKITEVNHFNKWENVTRIFTDESNMETSVDAGIYS